MQNLQVWPLLAVIATIFNISAHVPRVMHQFLRRLDLEVGLRVLLANAAISVPLLDVFQDGGWNFAIKGILNVVLIVVWAGLMMSVIDRPFVFVVPMFSLLAAVLIICSLRKQLKLRNCPACTSSLYYW